MFSELTPQPNFAQVPFNPRSVLGAAIWPFSLDHPLSPAEIGAERFLHRIETEATRPELPPAWVCALAHALAGLWGES